MSITQPTIRPGVTFAVDPVEPEDCPAKQCRLHEAIRRTLGGDIESCSDYHAMVLDDGIDYQPLLAAVYTAFNRHYPLVLTPDAVWLTIAQGVAHHMAVHGERLRERFVSHQGRLDLSFVCDGWVERSPENPWTEAFASWAGQVRDHVGPAVHDLLVPDFSTTGPLERAVGQIVLLDVFERYFHYRTYAACGIPSVTLEGTVADWERLRAKAEALRPFDMDWWLDHLLPICNQFVRASRGEPDVEHWRDLCKRRSEYGGAIINGWVAKLFPYLKAFTNGPCSRRNPIFETGDGFPTSRAPSGLSRVPFTWRNSAAGPTRRMEAIGGLVGVAQDAETLALRPVVGWAIRPADRLDVLLTRVDDAHRATPAVPPLADAEWGRSELPPDVSAFYHRYDGAELFGPGTDATCRIVPKVEMQPLDWGEVDTPHGGTRGPGGRIWHRFAWLADGSWLAINLDLNIHRALPLGSELRERCRRDESFAPICHVSADTQAVPGRNPVVALSFADWLDRTLDGDGRPYWLDPAFVPLGDAEDFTRRP